MLIRIPYIAAVHLVNIVCMYLMCNWSAKLMCKCCGKPLGNILIGPFVRPTHFPSLLQTSEVLPRTINVCWINMLSGLFLAVSAINSPRKGEPCFRNRASSLGGRMRFRLPKPGTRTCRYHFPPTIPKHFPNLSEIATLIKTLCM